MTITQCFATARAISHDALAVVGIASGSVGVLASALDTFGIHVGSVELAHFLLVAGTVVTATSKAIDSLNNVFTSKSIVPTVTPKP